MTHATSGSTARDSQPPGRRHVPLGSVILIIAGSLLCLVGLVPFVGGSALVWAYGTQRDADGYFTTGTERYETTSSALTTEDIDLGAGPGNRRPFDDIGGTRIRLDVASNSERAVFIGIASEADVDRYLNGVAHAELRNAGAQPFAAEYRYVDGDRQPAPPRSESIWVASAEGTGTQSLQWELETGRWAVVVMNADASAGVSVDASAGARAPWVLGLGAGILALGALVLLIGGVMVVVGVVTLARRTEIDLTAHAEGPAVRLGGRLDVGLNRWLWLVKWLLLIPHVIVLAVLWIAFAAVTVIAFFAILFTGRYPRALFEFNVGVLRWTWRVNFYGYSALGTDAYPPFTLAHDPDYPATLQIAYPERLSRGLVLIKWWLLAIPQYLVLAVIGGGLLIGTGSLRIQFAGLIGLLVTFAAVALLFTGTYPRGIFDLVVGLNRWVYRVIAYVALLRDDYPPFRLDQGADEPVAAEPPSGTGATAAPEPTGATIPADIT
jgi:hypothetical protein